MLLDGTDVETIAISASAAADEPAATLRTVDRARRDGRTIVLRDIGGDIGGLALMPLLAPDVIRLDVGRFAGRPTVDVAAVANAVTAQAELSGATIVAEGLANPGDVEFARALGAEYGEGPLFSQTTALSERPPAPAPRRPPPPEAATPFALVAGAVPVRRGDKALLLTISRQLEQQATAQGAGTILLAAFQEAHRLTPLTCDLYSALSRRLAFVGALAVDLPAEPAPGLLGGPLEADDPLAREWDVTIVAPHFAAAFAARDLGDPGPDPARRFDFAITYDRPLVVATAQALMRRIAG